MNTLDMDQADAQLFVLFCVSVLKAPGQIGTFFDKLHHTSANTALRYCSAENLLNVLLLYSSPVLVSVSEVSTIASNLFSAYLDAIDTDPEDLLKDLQDHILWFQNIEINSDSLQGDDVCLQAAKELVSDACSRASLLGLSGKYLGHQELAFAFAQAKTLQLSSYLPNLDEYSPLFLGLEGYSPFDAWYNGIICPYQYYWVNYASLQNSNTLPQAFLDLDSHYDQFDFLCAPFDSPSAAVDGNLLLAGGKLALPMYLDNVILPLAFFHGKDLNPLSLWVKTTQVLTKLSQDFTRWDEVIRKVLTFSNHKSENFPTEATNVLVRNYVAFALYYGLYRETQVGSVDKIRIHELICSTTSFLTTQMQLKDQANINFDLASFPDSVNFSEFLLLPKIASLLENSLEPCVLYLNKMVSLCCVLFPINGFTIRRFAELKQENPLEVDTIQKEVFTIFMHVSDKNYNELLHALELFRSTFLSDIVDIRMNIDRMVFERLVEANRIDLGMQFLKRSNTPSDINGYYEVAVSKFWANFNSATSIEQVLASSTSTQQCFTAIEDIVSFRQIDGQLRETVVGFKHLFRALSLLKNFRFHFVKGQPVTPQDILEKLTSIESEETFTPMSLVSVILEQNPKSYLVNEKLYKIAIDLSIYIGFQDSWVSFYKVRSACIESALIERDFSFAYKQSRDLILNAVEQNKTESLNDIWLIFYQVGKFVPREWMDDFDVKIHKEKIGILSKQREILSLALKFIGPSPTSGDHSRLLVGQFRSINDEITRWYGEQNAQQHEDVSDAMNSARTTLQENFSGVIKNAAESKNQASEKISNLLVSGLGWAIGANTNRS